MRGVAELLFRVVVTAVVQVIIFVFTVQDARDVKRHANIWGGKFL